jgi:hypothetical protein
MANPILTELVCDIRNAGHIGMTLQDLLDVRIITFACSGGMAVLDAAAQASTAIVDRARANGVDGVRSFLVDCNGPLRFMVFGGTVATTRAADRDMATAVLAALFEKMSQHPPFSLRVVGLPLYDDAARPIPPALGVSPEDRILPEDLVDVLAAGGPPQQFAIDGRAPALDAMVMYYGEFDCEIPDFAPFRAAFTAPRVVRMAAMPPGRVDCVVTRSDRFVGMPPAE